MRQNRIIYFDDLCVDCGACINVCPENVYVPVIDEIQDFEKFELEDRPSFPHSLYTVRAEYPPAPDSQALKTDRFRLIVDTSQETHDMSYVISEHLKSNPEGRPILSSFCPAIIRFIQVRYPNLMELISTFDVPREITAKSSQEKIFRRAWHTCQ